MRSPTRVAKATRGFSGRCAFDDLSRLLTAPRTDWRAWCAAWAMELAGRMIMGLAIGVGIAAGMALPDRQSSGYFSLWTASSMASINSLAVRFPLQYMGIR